MSPKKHLTRARAAAEKIKLAAQPLPPSRKPRKRKATPEPAADPAAEPETVAAAPKRRRKSQPRRSPAA
jgi:hypothetical protein